MTNNTLTASFTAPIDALMVARDAAKLRRYVGILAVRRSDAASLDAKLDYLWRAIDAIELVATPEARRELIARASWVEKAGLSLVEVAAVVVDAQRSADEAEAAAEAAFMRRYPGIL